MRHYHYLNIMLACVLLVSCAPPTRSRNAWDGYDYSRGASPRAKARRDYDADYSFPATATTCVDDSPGCY